VSQHGLKCMCQLQACRAMCAASAVVGSYGNAAWAARQVEREAAEALESGAPPDAAVAAQYAAFAERQASLLQVRGPLFAQRVETRSVSSISWSWRMQTAACLHLKPVCSMPCACVV
jgi:hypothetical protein